MAMPPEKPDPPVATGPRRVSAWGADHIGCLAMAGMLLCATVVGAFIGVPLLFLSFILLFVDVVRRWHSQTVTGHCPYCGTSIGLEGGHDRCACHGCGRALRVVGRQFVPAPD
jgi:hypothetical protein